jgi:hydroxylamine reductase (hybrid-cluster protein)
MLLLLRAGHFGGAWYRQKIDFSAFPGAVLATTNCVLDPPKAYKNRLFTTNEVRVVCNCAFICNGSKAHRADVNCMPLESAQQPL